jgi:hypothetical protein
MQETSLAPKTSQSNKEKGQQRRRSLGLDYFWIPKLHTVQDMPVLDTVITENAARTSNDVCALAQCGGQQRKCGTGERCQAHIGRRS